MEFNNRVLWVLRPLGLELWITETIFNTWCIMAIIIVFALFARHKIKKFTDKPTGFQNVLELAIETIEDYTIQNMGEKYGYFAKWFFALFVLIFFFNWSGLIGMRPPTADLATTAAFGISTFVLIHFMGVTKSKLGYLKSYIEPNPVFFPINLLGNLATPVSLSFRLFGNILGGFIILGLVYALFPFILRIAIPVVLHVYFDVFAGTLQAFIFVTLSMTFIKEKLPEEE